MKIGIAYGLPQRQIWLTLEVPEGTTVADAIARSGIGSQFPDIDLEKQKVGIFGKFARLDAVLADGDRVEIYRPLLVDPKTVRKKGPAD